MFKGFIYYLVAPFVVVIALATSNYGMKFAQQVIQRVPVFSRVLHLAYIDVIEIGHELQSIVPRSDPNVANTYNLELSNADIFAFSEIYKNSLADGFLRDSNKVNRSGEFSVDGSMDRVKLSIHGTSLTPLQTSYGGFRNLLPWDTGTLLAPSRGGWSFKVRLHKDRLLDYQRRINLLTPYDDWTFGSQVINKVSSSIGLITPAERVINLKINNHHVGPYLMQESIDAVMLERDYQLTDTATVKLNDDWDTLDGPHRSLFSSVSDLYDVKSDKLITQALATEALTRLFEAVNKDDEDVVMAFIDLDSFAKVVAVEQLYGTNHSTAGDNTKYIFDASTGTFFLSFRAEGAPKLVQSGGRLDFKLGRYERNPLLEYLLQKSSFRERVIKALNEISERLPELSDLYYKKVIEFDALENPRESTLFVKFKSINDLKVLESNLNRIHRILGYSKVYITVNENQDSVKVLLDAYRSAELEVCGEIFKLRPARDRRDVLNTIRLPKNCSADFKLRDENRNTIDSRHIYIRRIQQTTASEIRGIKGVVKKSNDEFTIGPGLVNIENTIKFPRGASVIVLPGTTISIASGKSILVRGNFSAVGTAKEAIKVTKAQEAFGSLAILGSGVSPAIVDLQHFTLEGGSEAYIDSVYYSGQMSIHRAEVSIRQSKFRGSISDDGLNIKRANVYISDSEFSGNRGDQIDLDFCIGDVTFNRFIGPMDNIESISTDGLDLSGSVVLIKQNTFGKFSDKGVSVGERSNVDLIDNVIADSNIGIAVKDGSVARLIGNKFIKNGTDYTQYVKKPFFKEPKINLQ